MTINDQYNYWPNTITTGMGTYSGDYTIGTEIFETTINPWGNHQLDYDGFTYRGNQGKEAIEVDKGSPAKARFAIFYAVKKDPVIFCKTRRDLYKEVKKLLKRKEVDIKSIRIFQLIGGAKRVLKSVSD